MLWLFQNTKCSSGFSHQTATMGTSRAYPTGEISVHCSMIPWEQLPDTPQLLVAKSHCHQALMGFSKSCADAEALAWQPRCTLAIHVCHIPSPTLPWKPFPTFQTDNTFAVTAGNSSPGQTLFTQPEAAGSGNAFVSDNTMPAPSSTCLSFPFQSTPPAATSMPTKLQ